MTQIGTFVQEANERPRWIALQQGTTIVSANNSRALKVAKVALAAANDGANCFNWQNPESTEVLVTRVMVNVTTAGGDAASRMNVGVVAATGATANDIFNDLLPNTVQINDHLVLAPGIGGVHKVAENGGANDWITGRIHTANSAALAGEVYIEYTEV